MFAVRSSVTSDDTGRNTTALSSALRNVTGRCAYVPHAPKLTFPPPCDATGSRTSPAPGSVEARHVRASMACAAALLETRARAKASGKAGKRMSKRAAYASVVFQVDDCWLGGGWGEPLTLQCR